MRPVESWKFTFLFFSDIFMHFVYCCLRYWWKPCELSLRRCCEPLTREFIPRLHNIKLYWTKLLTFIFSLSFPLALLHLSFSSLPTSLAFPTVLINMLLYGCPLRKAGSLFVFTSCSLRVALPGGYGACIMKRVPLFWVTTSFTASPSCTDRPLSSSSRSTQMCLSHTNFYSCQMWQCS